MPGTTAVSEMAVPLKKTIVGQLRQLIYHTRLFDVDSVPEGGDIESFFTLK